VAVTSGRLRLPSAGISLVEALAEFICHGMHVRGPRTSTFPRRRWHLACPSRIFFFRPSRTIFTCSLG
jgi:hypothetical protein